MTKATKTEKTRTIEQGWNGSGNRVWMVVTTWVRECGRHGSHVETFDTEAEAVNWLKWG